LIPKNVYGNHVVKLKVKL